MSIWAYNMHYYNSDPWYPMNGMKENLMTFEILKTPSNLKTQVNYQVWVKLKIIQILRKEKVIEIEAEIMQICINDKLVALN